MKNSKYNCLKKLKNKDKRFLSFESSLKFKNCISTILCDPIVFWEKSYLPFQSNPRQIREIYHCIGEKKPAIGLGLSAKQVEYRKKAGLQNQTFIPKTKSYSAIFFHNIFSLFNGLNAGIALLVIYASSIGQWQYLTNLAYMGAILSNITIGIIQEVRSKRTIDKLSILNEPSVDVLRSGLHQNIPVEELVIGDIMLLSPGNQVVVDGIFLSGEGFEVDESLLTGESLPIAKTKNDLIYSGSFVASGTAFVVITQVGNNTFASKLALEVKKIKKVTSHIMISQNRIIKFVSTAIIPLGILLFLRQSKGLTNPDFISLTIIKTVTLILSMIPEGLILMTSVAFAVAIYQLGRKYSTLVQTAPSVETLARVDTICLDKTGTITTGEMAFLSIYPLKNGLPDIKEPLAPSQLDYEHLKNKPDLICSISTVLFQKSKNTTQIALNKALSHLKMDWLLVPDLVVPFSSARKWSGAYFKGQGSFMVGAPEFILNVHKQPYKNIQPKIQELASQGLRVLLVAKMEDRFEDDRSINGNVVPLALLCVGDQLRPDAIETFRFMIEQDVDIKVISGDNALTVSSVAKRAQIPHADKYIDLSVLTEPIDYSELVKNYYIFGRVTPYQKRSLLHALQDLGHIVAMTGDGVNDILALKDADCSVSLASGSDAAKTCSNIVLLDNSLNSITKAILEGRQVINNIELVAILFLNKTIYAILLAVIFIVLPYVYPLMPIQMTLVSSIIIGVPSFILALKPNKKRVTGDFLQKVLFKALPSALASVIMIVLIQIVGYSLKVPANKISTISALAFIISGLYLLWQISKPLDWIKAGMWAICLSIFVTFFVFFPKPFFLVSILDPTILMFIPFLFLSIPLMIMMKKLRGIKIIRFLIFKLRSLLKKHQN